MGEMVSYPANGHTTTGYLATRASGTGPGLLVIQEWWGLVDHIKTVADRLAAAGFVALAPDFYAGETTQSPDAAAKLFMALNIDRAGADLRGSADYLLSRSDVTSMKVGALGFCMGGQLALYAGMTDPSHIGCAVDFYGIHPNVPIDPARVKVPVLGKNRLRGQSGRRAVRAPLLRGRSCLLQRHPAPSLQPRGSPISLGANFGIPPLTFGRRRN